VARTVLIVDDHADFRLVARELLTQAGYVVVGEAADGSAAVSATESLRPGVVLLDIQLPDSDGFAVAERLAQLGHPPVVLLTSSRDATSYRQRLAASSARAFIAKAELSATALASALA
jgi:two-component system nitrate/nitrite response regulator NarL